MADLDQASTVYRRFKANGRGVAAVVRQLKPRLPTDPHSWSGHGKVTVWEISSAAFWLVPAKPAAANGAGVNEPGGGAAGAPIGVRGYTSAITGGPPHVPQHGGATNTAALPAGSRRAIIRDPTSPDRAALSLLVASCSCGVNNGQKFGSRLTTSIHA